MNNELKGGLEAGTSEAPSDPRSTHELISTALIAPDEEVASEAILALHYRATREVFDAASQLCKSECPQERSLGANILGQLGIPDRTFRGETVKLLVVLI